MAQVNVIGGLKYTRVLPQAQYSPWLGDEDFVRVFKKVESNTFVDVYRCFELWQLVQQVGTTFGDILEVGVWRGGSGALLAAAAEMHSAGKRVFLCDTFSGVVKASVRDPLYKGGEHANTSVDIVAKLLADVGAENVSIYEGVFPDQTGECLASSVFSLVHIDVDVYDSAHDIMEFVWPRLSVGGIVVFDDYGFLRCGGIARLVDGYRSHLDKLVIHNLNGHGLVIKK